MTTPPDAGQHADNGWLHRIVMLSDGVFAIAITLLAIELHAPEGWDGRAATLFGGEAGFELIAYALSFLVIAIYWGVHRRSFSRLTRADGWLTTLNFLLLALVTLVPPTTGLLYAGGPRSDAFFIYWCLVALIGLSAAAIWGYAAFIARLMEPGTNLKMRLGVMIMQAVVQPLMCGLSLYAAHSGSWLPLLALPVVGLSLGPIRRWLG